MVISSGEGGMVSPENLKSLSNGQNASEIGVP